MTISTKQLGLLLIALCAITLTIAWIIERRQILSFRQELDAYGVAPAAAAPPPAEPEAVSPDAPLPFVPPPAEPVDEPELAE